MGVIDDIIRWHDLAMEPRFKPMIYVNTLKSLDNHAIDFYKDQNIIVVTSDGKRYFRGKKLGADTKWLEE